MLIIVNPVAGRPRRARRRLDRTVAALQRRGCAVVQRRTAAERDAEWLAREAEADFDVVVAAGGDGTVNAVANGLAAGRALAVLPLGTANVLAREIGLPNDPEGLARLIAGGTARPVWPGRIDGRLFLMMASSGFDSEVVATVEPRLKRRLGRLAFVLAIARLLWRYRDPELFVTIDGIEHRAATVIAAKGRHYAGPYIIAPGASLAEPMLDFVLFRRAGRLAAVGYLVALLCGRLPLCSDVVILRARDAVVGAAAALPVQADGEIVSYLPARIGLDKAPMLLVQP